MHAETNWKRTLYASAAASFIGNFSGQLAFPFIPFYLKDLGVSGPELKIWTGLIGSAFSLMMGLSSPVWGFLSDKFSRKLMMLRATAVMIVLMTLMGFARNKWDLLTLRILQGILAGSGAANLALLASIIPLEKTAVSLAFMDSMSVAGMFAGSAVGGFIVEAWGFSWGFWSGTIGVAISFAIILFFVEEPVRSPERQGRSRTPLRAYWPFFLMGAFMLVLLARFQVNFAGAIGLPLFPLYLIAFRGLEGSSRTLGLILSSSTATMMIALPLAGKLSDKWGHKRMIVYSTLGSSIVMLALTFAQNVAHLWILRCLLSFFLAGLGPSSNALIRKFVSEKDLGKAYSLSQGFQSIGSATGPLAGGLVAALWSGVLGIRVAFFLTGALMLIVPWMVARYLKTENAAPGKPEAAISDSVTEGAQDTVSAE